ncbi:Adaptive-response sensory-kinase SasA [Eubacterium plexicaudatum ASF492]|jgi:signal transduction histidine kinase|uniref:histidine kinase n=1 Tax=Eubacterium plexicaudatum ASF492 TaxID=1235802 RepID=N1ZYC2_9FIRM|nr:Adaptive-response sensory-kinase SasA [Eubacterium plexicaudatum ASF492]NBI63947.1 sensor histidine kinase [Clostridiales bacterium]NBI87951.1 sensor histidine kinase [Lachnospiraceae bacterium]RKJ17876.1 sensor histidine kinase [bacterium D16-50]
MKNSDNLSIYSIRKKILLMSKVIGAILVISYILSTKLPFSSDISLSIWTVFVVLLIFGVDFLMSCFISKPIAKLEKAAKRMADLDFSSSCDIMTNDEFGRLSTSLNVMADNLQNALMRLEAANKQLEKDVEKERLLLSERKELVDSLSHEMKTPLGIIRAYAEGYQDEDDELKKQKYAEIIISETERMNHLITALLDLSALETGAVQLTSERFDFVELLETVAGRLLIDTPDANFELQYELPDYKIYVCTDKIRMEQVLNNLIINAKKNVKPDGILKLCLSDENGLLHFSVYNQGETIPNEKLKKIWTKFYRDNRLRYSGSGLGLAIVAQILSMQELSYGVKNLADGVQFYFSIPTVK